MWTSTCRRPASDALIAAAIVLAATAARADYRESYRRGVEAAARESWGETTRFMRAALAEQPREGEPILVEGSRTEGYVPRYYLGLALFHTGNCMAARREWEAGKTAIRRTPYIRTVAKLNQDCQKRAPREAAANRLAPAVEADLRKAERLAAAVAVVESNPALSVDQRAELEKGLRDSRERLAEARVKLDEGRRDADLRDLDKARELVQRATADIEKTRRKAMAGLDPQAGRPVPSAPPTTAAAARAPAELLAAAHAYFEGRYEDVVRTLTPVTDDTGPVALQAHLLRAAASHALYVMGGSRDEALLRAVTAEVDAVLRIDPDFQPDASAFSPRLRELFRRQG
jgi:hypothetical protein